MDMIYHGIDVSRWQGTINWSAVKSAGVNFAFIRVGYCGYTGNLVLDTQFLNNIQQAAAAGIDVGVYVYSYAKTAAAATQAANETLQQIEGFTLNFPVAFDFEDTIYQSMSTAENTAIAEAFLSTIEQAGYCPILYTFKSLAESKLNMSQLAAHDFWLAHVTSQTNYAGPYTVWQYSWTGSIDGINGDVDLNRCYKDYPAYIKENGLNGYGGSGAGEDENNSDDDDNEGDDGGSGEDNGSGDGDESSGETPAEPEEISHVVVKNDTLSHIAQQYGVSLRAVIQANPQIKNPDLIYVGDIIHIPAKSSH